MNENVLLVQLCLIVRKLLFLCFGFTATVAVSASRLMQLKHQTLDLEHQNQLQFIIWQIYLVQFYTILFFFSLKVLERKTVTITWLPYKNLFFLDINIMCSNCWLCKDKRRQFSGLEAPLLPTRKVSRFTFMLTKQYLTRFHSFGAKKSSPLSISVVLTLFMTIFFS